MVVDLYFSVVSCFLCLISTCSCRFFVLFLCWAWFSGYFSGQTGYGYRSFEAFIDAVRQIEAGSATAEVSQKAERPKQILFRKTNSVSFGKLKKYFWKQKAVLKNQNSVFEIKTPFWKNEKARLEKKASFWINKTPLWKNQTPLWKKQNSVLAEADSRRHRHTHSPA